MKSFLPFLTIFSLFYTPFFLFLSTILVFHLLKQWGFLRAQEVRVEGNKSISTLGREHPFPCPPYTHLEC